jgi:hypothetical protein
MLCAFENPHWHGFPSALESATPVEPGGVGFGDQHVLMKPAIAVHEAFHDLSANALTLILGENEKMRIVNHKRFVRNRIAEANE